MIAHLMRKDLRQIALPLLAVVIWQVSQATLILGATNLDDLAPIWRLPLAELLLTALAGMIVLTDPPARRGARWQLLPVSPWRLTCAKLGLIVTILALSAGLQTAVIARIAPVQGELLLVFAEALLRLTTITAVAMGIAALVSDLARFAAALLGALMLSVLLHSPLARLDLAGQIVGLPSREATQDLLGCLALLLGGVAVYATQLRFRDRRRSLALAAATFAITVALAVLPVDLLSRPARGAPAAAELRLADPTWSAPNRGLTLAASLVGVPAGVTYKVTGIDLELAYGDGRTETLHDPFVNTRLGCESPELAALLRSDRPLTSVGDPCRTSHRPKIYLTRTRLSRESIVMATSMRATVEAEALELQATARPIRSVDRELRLEVDPEHGVMIDGLTGSQSFAVLLLRGETAAYRRLPEPPWPVLYHPSRRELAQNVNHRGGSGRMWALLWYPSLHSMHWQIEAVASQKHHFFEEPYASVDEAWLEEAELITFHWRWLGTVRWSVELDGVEIGRPD